MILSKMKEFTNQLCLEAHKMTIIELTEKELLAKERLCLALDNLSTIEEFENRIKELSPVVGLFKIGKGSFTRFGPEAVEIARRYTNVFLDLKDYDTPNTVEDVAYATAKLGVYMFSVHALGGVEMMRAAVRGARKASEEYKITMPKIVGVTILTSIDKEIMNDELKIRGSVEDQVLNLAIYSEEAGLDGVVCSASDLKYIKGALKKDFMYVTPGTQFYDNKSFSGQKRVFTPGDAIRDGSHILVAGRIISEYKTPEERIIAGHRVLKEMTEYL